MTKETKFTPGSWTCTPVYSTSDTYLVYDKDGNFHAGDMVNKDEMDANANLIAAAPDLYLQLSRLITCVDAIRHSITDEETKRIIESVLDDGRQTLASAKGE